MIQRLSRRLFGFLLLVCIYAWRVRLDAVSEPGKVVELMHPAGAWRRIIVLVAVTCAELYMQSMKTPPVANTGPTLAEYPLLTALRERRSRRFGLGMKMPAGPLAFQSRHSPTLLTEDEEAAMVFAGCGITGHALADLCYSPGGGGGIMAGLVARTIASGDGLQTVSLIVINDSAT